MPQPKQTILRDLIDAAQSVAFCGWIVAIVAVPVALFVQAYSLALLVAVLVVCWQLLSVGAAILVRDRRRGQPRFRYRLTSWGLVYGAIALVFCVASLQWGLNLVYLMTAFLLAGAVCTVLFPRLMLASTDTGWGLPAHVFAGDLFPVEVTLRNRKRLLGAFGLAVESAGGDGSEGGDGHRIYRLPPGGEHKMLLQQCLPRRGTHRLQPVRVGSAFPFGLVETTLVSQPAEEILVLPHLGRIHQDTLSRYRGGEAKWLLDLRRKDPQGEFRSLREYQHGDNYRHIHWPTSARLKKLYVREFEQREMHSLLILLDAQVGEDGPAEVRAHAERFEKAVSFVATMATLLTERSVFYAFASYCPHLVTLPYDFGAGHLFAVLEALALAEPSADHSLADLVGALSFHEVSTGGICLVTPGPAGPEEARAALGVLAHRSVCIDVSEPEFDEIFSS